MALRPVARYALLLLLLGGCETSPPESAPPIDFAAFDAAIETFIDDNDLEGATAVVVHRAYGVLHERAYGEFSIDRISLIASSSKVMSTGVLMHLSDQGLLDIDEPISTHLAQWGEHKTNITVAQLLSNSAGMVGLIEAPRYSPYLCQFVDVSSLYACAQDIYTADDQEDRVPPDTQYRYGGGQWQLAGGIAEVVSGKSWAELVEEVYVEPCGLVATGYTNQYARAFVGGDADVDVAFSYPRFFDGDLDDLLYTENPNIEGGAYTTIGDYAEILLLHLRGGRCDDGQTRVLSEASVDRMREDRIGEIYGGNSLNPTLEGYGLGWFVDRDDPSLVADAGAYGTVPWIDFDRGYGVMIIIEGSPDVGGQLRLITQPIVESALDDALL